MSRPAQCVTPGVYAQEIILANVGVTEGVVTPKDVGFHVTNPSVRLHMSLFIFARPNAGAANVHDYTGDTWQLTVLAEGNPEVPINAVFNNGASPPSPVAQTLPDSYEADTGVKRLAGAAHITGNKGNPPADMILRATWEAIDSPMTDKERADLYALCRLTVDNPSNIPQLLG